MAKSYRFGALARCGEERRWRGAMGIFLEKVMLYLPRIVVPALVSEFDLRERVLEVLVLAVLMPRPRNLVFVKYAEFHALYHPL